jgi:hypothetical protein
MTALLLVIGLMCARPAGAQGITAGRPDFSGTWTLDTYLSDGPAQIAQEIRIDTGQPGEEALLGRGTELGGFGGRGRGGRGGFGGRERGDARTAEQFSAEDRKKLTELTDPVQFASPTLTISQTETTIAIAGVRSGSQTLTTNGKAEKQALEAGVVDRVARWEGPALVVGYDVGHAGTVTYKYTLVPTTRQLLIRVNFERIRGQPGPFDIRLVYDRPVRP